VMRRRGREGPSLMRTVMANSSAPEQPEQTITSSSVTTQSLRLEICAIAFLAGPEPVEG
jgi:hypothetical protein